MDFLQNIFERLQIDAVLIEELREQGSVSVTGRELLRLVDSARGFLQSRGLNKGERCALLAANSIRWAAMDLAMMAEGLIVVPLYSRQAPAELVAMMKDCSPSLICCAEAELRDGIASQWPGAPPQFLFDDIFATPPMTSVAPHLGEADPVTIIYTSGTSGEAKGVIINAGNVAHILGCTSERLDILMGRTQRQDRVFHYTPFSFAAAWIMLLTCLTRQSRLLLNTDLSRVAADMRRAAPDYFVNVPLLLERMRKGVDEQLWKTGGIPLAIYSRAKAAYVRKLEGKAKLVDPLFLSLAESIVFPTIRKKMIGENLKALICGSAPLNVETQLYFMLLGIPVLQVYGLTETTAICTMDDPRQVEPGRVGPAIRGIEMTLGESDEILIRGHNIFPGYWNRPQDTAKVLRDGWFHTGDQGEVNAAGNWKIIGRIKNLIILASGHNLAPEPIEDEILQRLPDAQQVVLVGNGRSYLSALLTGKVSRDKVQAVLDEVNAHLPHYRQVRAFHIHPETFSIENGLLTANGKLKRDLIASTLQAEIEEMYRTPVSAGVPRSA